MQIGKYIDQIKSEMNFAVGSVARHMAARILRCIVGAVICGIQVRRTLEFVRIAGC